MQLKLRVTYVDDRSFEQTVGPAEIIALEDWDKEVNALSLSSAPKTKWMYYLGFLAAKKSHKRGDHPGAIKPTFPEFLEVVEDVEPVPDESVEGPFGETTPESSL